MAVAGCAPARLGHPSRLPRRPRRRRPGFAWWRTSRRATSHSPPFAVQQGRHEFDGRLPDWGPEGLRATANWLYEQRDLAERFDEHLLSAEQRFEWQYLLSRIDTFLFWQEEARQPTTNPAFTSTAGSTRAGTCPAVRSAGDPAHGVHRVPAGHSRHRHPNPSQRAHPAAPRLREVRRRRLRRFPGLLSQRPPIPLVREQMLGGAGGSLF
jgi:hypothetical protein